MTPYRSVGHNMPKSSKSRTNAILGYDNTEDEYGAGRYGVKQISNLKAELVRKNMISRGDLMKLYKPQLKKQELDR